MAVNRKTIAFAVQNIAHYGDTDVYPYPIENHIFFDAADKVVDVLHDLDKNFKRWLSASSPSYVKSLTTAGYAGFRAPTQIDPVWNAYLLGLVLSVASKIEQARLPIEKRAVFAYRYSPNTKDFSLFNKDIGWRQFHETSLEHTRKFKYVLVADIADFYPRIYHHRLENALKKACPNKETVNRIMQILGRLSDGVSYGLPIGGPAARILSELLLNRTDQFLATNGITFCRFVDDFHLFANSPEEAYSHLLDLSQALMENEGLSLQKTKTRIMSSEEFIAASPYADGEGDNSDDERTGKSFLKIRLRYDPYSPTADDDYEALKSEISQFDVVGMLSKELRKTRIDETLTRQLVKSIKYLESDVRDSAITSLADNMNNLYPVFPSVALVLMQTLGDTTRRTQNRVYETIRKLVQDNSFILRVATNLAYAIRIFAQDPADEASKILVELYKQPLNMMLKRDIILAMAKRNADFWISNCRKQFLNLSPWERRAVLVASFILEDEGAHWRRAIRPQLNPSELLVLDWAAAKKSAGVWEIPL